MPSLTPNCFHHSTAGRQALQQTIDQNEAKASELRGKLWTTVNGSAVYDQAEREKLQNDIDRLVRNETATALAHGHVGQRMDNLAGSVSDLDWHTSQARNDILTATTAARDSLRNDIDGLVRNDTAAAVARGSLNSHITGVNETIMGEFVTAHITAAMARAALQASIDTNAATMTITADQEQAIAATQEANMKALIIGSTICPDGQSINASSFAMRENVSATTDYCTEDPALVDFYGTTNQPVCCQ